MEYFPVLKTIGRFVTALMVVIIVLEGAALAYQTIKLRDSAKRSDDLQQEIFDMKLSVALTERLHEYNAELTQDQFDMGRDLQVAAGYNDPLSPDILRVLDRLHAATRAPQVNAK